MLPSGGGNYAAIVHRVGGSCGWTATADSTAQIVGPVSGNGDGYFVFRVLPSLSTFQFGGGSVQWDGGSAPFGYVQVACSVFTENSLTFDAAGGRKVAGEILFPACPTLETADSQWITIETPASGGVTIVAIVAPNTSGVTRSGTVTVKTVFGDAKTVTITQAGS